MTTVHRYPLEEAPEQFRCNALAGAYKLASNDKPMSCMAMMVRWLQADCTVCGFRSVLRDWTSERTNFAREICEAALAHVVKDKTEAVYRRGELEKRRPTHGNLGGLCDGRRCGSRSAPRLIRSSSANDRGFI
jgi:hypothetical protein